MKKLILLFAILPIICSAQIEFPLVKDGGIWREVNMGYNFPSSEITYIFSQFVMQGDTIIDSLLYKKVFSVDYNAKVNSIYIGAIRETIDEKVWYVKTNGSPLSGPFCHNGPSDIPVLLYDFSLEVGDTFDLYDAGYPIIVMSMDSAEIDGQWRKRWYYKGNDLPLREVIKGIGDTKGLFFPFCYEFESSHLLTCYEDSNMFWLNPVVASMGADCFSVGIKKTEDQSKSYTLNVFPNPVSNSLNFEFENNTPENSFIIIYNPLGEQLLTKHISSNKKLVNIDFSDYNSGIYFYRIIGDNGVVNAGKFLKL